jgi:UPF0755 protein
MTEHGASGHALELPFAEEEHGTRRARHRHRRKRKRERRRAFGALVGVVVILALLAGGIWYGVGRVSALFDTPDYSGPGSGTVTVKIAEGQTASDIAETLADQDVVKSVKAFVKVASDDPRSRNLQPGTYSLRKQMKASAALDLLLNPVSKISLRFTIPEGLTITQTLDRIAKQTRLPLAQLQAAAKTPSELGLPSWSRGQLEGFLYPDTYTLEPEVTATQALKAMVARTLTVMTDIDFLSKAQAVNLEPQEALIVASLLEGEGIPEDFSKIARVVYNRLKVPMPLQFDSTTNYGRELRGEKRTLNLSRAQLYDSTNAYSTHARPGLPPGAISSPGQAALEAAVAPADGPWLFFVAIDKQGHSAFAATLAEHDANIVKAKANGVFG